MLIRRALALSLMLTLTMSVGFAQPPVSSTGTYGGAGGSRFELLCPPGTYMNGLRARHGSWIDALSPICAVWVRSNATLGELGNQASAGGGGGHPAFIRCAGRRGVVVGIEVFQADNRDGSVGHIVVNCGDYRQPDQFWNKLGGSVDFLGNSQIGPRRILRCRPGEVATGIHGRSGAFVDRIGLFCVRPVL
jgi:hypothetical protein